VNMSLCLAHTARHPSRAGFMWDLIYWSNQT